MPQFDRFDICAAHAALEYDWNQSGILQDRPSNIRRRMSTGYQLARMGYRPAPDSGSFDTLENDNQRDIYCAALERFGMVRYLSESDPTHSAIIAHARAAGFAWEVRA